MERDQLVDPQVNIYANPPPPRDPLHAQFPLPPRNERPKMPRSMCYIFILIFVLLLGSSGTIGYLLYRVKTDLDNKHNSHEGDRELLEQKIIDLESKDTEHSVDIKLLDGNLTYIYTELSADEERNLVQNKEITDLEGDNTEMKGNISILREDIINLESEVEAAIEEINEAETEYLAVSDELSDLKGEAAQMRYILFDTNFQAALDVFFYKAPCEIIIEGIDSHPNLWWEGDGHLPFDCAFSTRGQALIGREGVKVCIENPIEVYTMRTIGTQIGFCAHDQGLTLYEGGNTYIYLNYFVYRSQRGTVLPIESLSIVVNLMNTADNLHMNNSTFQYIDNNIYIYIYLYLYII